jgi:putative aminopeptidase FrvX
LATRREILRIAGVLASAPTVSYREHEPLARIRRELDHAGIDYATDRYGNLLARYRGSRARGRSVAFCAHTDHPGFIVEASAGRRAHARWIGGVQERYFPRARVRVETRTGPVRGRVVAYEKSPNGRVARIAITFDRGVSPGAIGGWDLTPFAVEGSWIRTKSADDLLGCAAIVCMLKDLVATRPAIDAWGLFTRAEEDGLFGASALAASGALPRECAFVSLETSRELPCGRLGQGVIVRVGDRMSVFDPAVSGGLLEAAEELAKRDRRFRFQRGLMDGGSCEASAFQAFGYAAGGLALPLGNYHNMGEKRTAEEVVHVDDLVGMARLLPVAARRLASGRSPLAVLRAKLSKRLPAAKRELIASRMLLGGLLTAGLIAGAATAGPLSDRATPSLPKSGAARPMLMPRGTEEADPLAVYDALRYDIAIRIDPPAETIQGSVTMLLRAETDIDAVPIDCGANLTVDSVAVDGGGASFSRPGPDELRVDLPGTIGAGDSALVAVYYHGGSIPSPFTGFEFFSKHGEGTDEFPVVSTMSEPDFSHAWWPCKDRFDDKAIASLTIDAPRAYVVAGFGLGTIEEEPVGDRRRTRWTTAYPITPYLVSFAASNYVSWTGIYTGEDLESMPLVFYAYPEDSSKAAADWTTTTEAITAFESFFGRYPFRNPTIGVEKLGIVEFPWRSGAMENQTMIFMGDGLVSGDKTFDSVLAHEVAHQWFGDAVTPTSIDHIWLNEGFATYGEALFYEHRNGTAGYRGWMQHIRSPLDFEYRGPLVEPDESFGSTVYRKGGWLLHMLRGVLGDQDFFRALNTYYDRYEYANASTDDFIRAVEETAGSDLRWFFTPWLYGVGRPRIAWDWETDGHGSANEVRLLISQTQDPIVYPRGAPRDGAPESFRFPLEVRMFAAGDSSSRTVFVGQRTSAFLIDDVPFRPDSIALDPDQWILREIAPRGAGLRPNAAVAFPNPSRGPTTFIVHVASGAPTEAEIFDPAGRRVRSFAPLIGAGPHAISWDGRNDAGDRVASGFYWLRTAGPGGSERARIVVIR